MADSKYIGATFGRLKVLSVDHLKKSGTKKFQHMACVCECGNTRVVNLQQLRRGETKECRECAGTKPYAQKTPHSKFVGQTFGTVTVIGVDRVEKVGATGQVQYLQCRCTCGHEMVICKTQLTAGIKHPCEICKRTKYPHNTSHPLYGRWLSMRDRCYNQNSAAYKHYGARGIQVCDKWRIPTLEGFNNFVADMGPCPNNLSIDRINVDGDYTPDNCRWADRITQNTNTRRGALYNYPKRKRGRPRKLD